MVRPLVWGEPTDESRVQSALSEGIPAALRYLGLDPNSTKAEDFKKAEALLTSIRPFVRKFHSSEYLSALATGEICFVVGWSGDIMQARARAAEAKSGVEIGYTIP